MGTMNTSALRFKEVERTHSIGTRKVNPAAMRMMCRMTWETARRLFSDCRIGIKLIVPSSFGNFDAQLTYLPTS
jgi:hypothetical protein